MGRDGLLVDVNEAWTEFTGYTRAQAIGRSFAEFLDPSSASLYRRKTTPELIGTAPAKETRSDEYRPIKSPDEVADIVLTARPERDPATGRFQHSLTVINDITARNRAEAALRQAQKLEALGSLTSGVAHDFNNLLMIILGSLELLAKCLPTDDARATSLVDTALKGATRGAALTARLLAFARQQEFAPRSVDPHALVAALHPMLAHLLGATIRIEEELPASLWNLHADPNQLELALINLAANARDAMPTGGRLCLAARNAIVASGDGAARYGAPEDEDGARDGRAPDGRSPDDRATWDGAPDEDAPGGGAPGGGAPDGGATLIAYRQPPVAPGAYVVLTVSDTGTGMDEIALARAADPFFTTKGPGKGTGLGLSMVHGFAGQSGGALRLSSRPGNGTSVELWLPRTADPVVEPVVDPSLNRGELKARRRVPPRPPRGACASCWSTTTR